MANKKQIAKLSEVLLEDNTIFDKATAIVSLYREGHISVDDIVKDVTGELFTLTMRKIHLNE